jgi:hypothetical protein
VMLCRRIGLLTTPSVAIDGSKFKAVNNRDKNFTRAKMERRLAQIEESVGRYLSQLDTADLQEPSEVLALKTAHLKDKLAKLASEVERLKAIEKEMLASPDQQISLTDPDSRSMATSGRGSGVVGYNVQVAVDTEHHLIVTHEVTNTGSDRSQLATVAKQAKAVLGADHLDAVADRGLLQQPGDTGLRASRHYGDTAEANDLRREVGWPFWEAGLRLSGVGGCLPLPCWRTAELPLHTRGGRQDGPPLLDDGVPALPAQSAMYAWSAASRHAMGA